MNELVKWSLSKVDILTTQYENLIMKEGDVGNKFVTEKNICDNKENKCETQQYS